MKFACDSCHAQYLISDDKIGPNGVIVRCKKCQNKIVVRRSASQMQAPQVKSEAPAPEPDAAAPQAVGGNGEGLGAPGAEAHGGDPLAAASTSEPAGLNEPGGIDDELGRAFESVLARPSGMGEMASEPANGADGLALAGSLGNDLESTTVVDLSRMASLTRPSLAPEEKNGAGAADASAADWFVAINDSQTGPLTLEGVRAHWDKGELSGDSLVWRAGLPDWKPLSSVPELADALAPVPKPPAVLERSEAPAGAIATGVQAPVTSALPPPQGAPAEPTWKPSAASALESLVQQELEALQKPPEKKPDPAAAAPEATAQAKGLIGELPPAVEERAPEASLPHREYVPAAMPREEESGGLPERNLGALPRPRREAAEPREDPSEEAPRKRSGLVVGVIIGVVLAAGAGAAYWFVLPRMQEQAPVATAPAQSASPASSAAAMSSTAPAQTPAPAPTAVAAAPAAATAQTEKAVPAAAQAEASAPREAAAAPSRAAAPGPAPAKPHNPKPAAAPVVASAKEPEPAIEAAPPPKPRASGSSIDDDFNRMFGATGGGAAAEAPAKKDKPKSTPYIPPAPSSGPVKESLGQGDIMEVVLAHKAAIKKCTEASGGSGTVAMRWTIRSDGAATNVQTMTQEFQKTPLANCLTGVIRGFRFPAYSGAQMAPIDFPFKF
jgi:predicted Zn finger-like uncharacterized protein